MDMILGINITMLTNDSEKTELLGFYFAFSIYVKEN